MLDAVGNAVINIWQTSMSQNWAEFLLFICVIAQFFCVTASITSAAMTRYVVSFPPATSMRPSGQLPKYSRSTTSRHGFHAPATYPSARRTATTSSTIPAARRRGLTLVTVPVCVTS